MKYSVIVPVYNRPDEMDELLQSLAVQQAGVDFEVVVIEDGSTIDSKAVVEKYPQLNILYFYKENTGPGDSRNFGMKQATGDYFILFDSDCIIPSDYMVRMDDLLSKSYMDCFGGTDGAQQSFTTLQKAINFCMTSRLTTGGVRGNSDQTQKFQPRSFNMGLSKKAFEATQGFGNIHPGEDPELVFRLWDLGFKTTLFKDLSVFHKRRINWAKFFAQVNKFGKVRPILDVWHPKYQQLKFVFPTLFILGLDVSLLLTILGYGEFLGIYGLYFLVVFAAAFISTKSLVIACWSVVAVLVQFYGYGLGYLKSTIWIKFLKKEPKEVFPELFFGEIR